MNSLTLTFKDKEVEENYQINQHQIEKHIYQRILLCGFAICFGSFIFQTYVGIYSLGFLSLGLSFLVLAAIYFARKSPNFLDWSSFFFGLCFSNFLLIIKLFGVVLTVDTAQYSEYYVGVLVMQGIMNFLIGTKYYLKAILIIYTSVLLFCFMMAQDSNFHIFPRYILLGQCILTTKYIHDYEKNKRELFLLKEKSQQHEKGFDQIVETAIINAEFKMKEDQVQFISCNQSAKDEYKIIDNKSFIQFIRSTLLSFNLINQNRQQVLNNMLKDAMTTKIRKYKLENFIYQLFTNTDKCKSMCKIPQDSNIYQQIFHFSAWLKNRQLSVKVFTYYEQHPKITIIAEANTYKDLYFQQKLKNDTLRNQLKKLEQQGQNNLSQVLIELKQKQRRQNKQQIQFNLYQFYNSLLNQIIFSNQMPLTPLISSFKLSNIFQEFKSILKSELKNKGCTYNFNLKPADDTMISCQWMIKQILLNLLFNSIQFSKYESKIEINVLIKEDYFTKRKIVKITLTDQTNQIQDNMISNLPILHPKTLWEYYHNKKQQKLSLGLVITSYLLKIVGPDQKVKVKQFTNYKTLKIRIYQNLPVFATERLLDDQKFKAFVVLNNQESEDRFNILSIINQ